MPVYRKAGRPNTWRVKIWHDGEPVERIVHGTKKEADAYEARQRVEIESRGAAPEDRVAPTFSSFCVRYAVHARAHLRPNTWNVRQYHLATLMDHLAEVRLTALSTETIERYKAERVRAGRKPRSVNNELAVLQAVLHYARDIGAPCASPKVKLLPVVGRGRVTFWTADQLAALFAAVEHEAPDLLPIVVFIANTGCRKGEALACEQGWIDMRRRLITIQPNEDWQPKDNEPREVPISDALEPWLERALLERRRWAFPCETGDRWAYWPKRSFDRARKAAGLVGGPHTLRHTFAAHFLAACPDMYLLSQILGHSETRTSRIYAHLLPTHLERARNAVNVAPGVGPAAHEAKKRWSR